MDEQCKEALKTGTATSDMQVVALYEIERLRGVEVKYEMATKEIISLRLKIERAIDALGVEMVD